MSIKPGTNFINKICAAILLVVLGAIPLVASAVCQFQTGSSTGVLAINPGRTTLFVPPGKTGILFTSSFVRIAGSARFTCDTDVQFGIVNATAGGAQAAPSTIDIPVGTTGLVWRWRFINGATRSALPSFGTRTFAGSSTIWNPDDRTYALELFSSGPVANGTVIPAGNYGIYRFGTLDAARMSLANDITIVTGTCATPDVSVNMNLGGGNKVTDFPSAGTGPSTRAARGFNLDINNCPSHVASVKYQFNVAADKILNATNSVIALTNPTAADTAKNIGLQLMDNDSNALALNTPIALSGYTAAAAGSTSSYSVPFKARYYKTGAAAVAPGAANAAVTFTMTYD